MHQNFEVRMSRIVGDMPFGVQKGDKATQKRVLSIVLLIKHLRVVAANF